MRLMTLFLLAGCAPVPEDVGESAEALYANDKAAFEFFVQKGLTNFQSAGIVGNLDQESGVNPASVQYGGGPGRGIAQWSVGGRWDTSSKDNVKWYAAQKGQSATSLNLQLEFIWYELTTFGYGFSQLKATTNVTDATVVFQDKYEICGTCVQSTRIADAKAVLAAYGAAPSYDASYVSQTWPLAAKPPLQLKCGESVAAKIVLKNGGIKTWDQNTRLGTTQPRDRASIFAGSDWVSANRPAEIHGTVAPNTDGTFAFSFHGPTGAACVPGVYKEYFGVVQEGSAWFSDNGQGGPPDDQIEALIELVAPDPATTTGGTSGGGTTTAGGTSGAGTTTTGGDTGGTTAGDTGGTTGGDSGGTTGGDTGGTTGGDTGATTGGMPSNVSGGCSVAGSSDGGWALMLVLALLIRRRRYQLVSR
jgi:Synergist-CTERM protein sorting domain-containing protein